MILIYYLLKEVFYNGNWYIIDGNALDQNNMKKSTNGTWIYAFEEIPITDKMTFKANHNLFVCKYITSNQQEALSVSCKLQFCFQLLLLYHHFSDKALRRMHHTHLPLLSDCI